MLVNGLPCVASRKQLRPIHVFTTHWLWRHAASSCSLADASPRALAALFLAMPPDGFVDGLLLSLAGGRSRNQQR
eukprot:15472979-Alexandrium_andersonii.AAC.1